ncbi:MAG TPA: hypothetical protein VGG75_22890 [Trebonia sp.]
MSSPHTLTTDDHRLPRKRKTDTAAQGISTRTISRRTLSPARVRVVGGSSRLFWARANADGGGAVGGFAGLVGGGAEAVRLGDGLVPLGLSLRLRAGLGLRLGNGLVSAGLGVGVGVVTIGLRAGVRVVSTGLGVGVGVVAVGLGDGRGHAP